MLKTTPKPMSANPQFRARESKANSPANPTANPPAPVLVPPPAPPGSDPLEALRNAITQLNSSGYLPDQAEVANVLAEATEALEHANFMAQTLAQCDAFLGEAQFEKAIEVLDAGLAVYPADPALVSRRSEVEEREKAFHTEAAVRTALAEAKWLLDQDRTDLAVSFLREKTWDLPDQRALTSLLQELEVLLPKWEQKRRVQATLARVATLEQTQQWQAALTVLEEALQSSPKSAELVAAAKRIRVQLVEHERQKKLARRMELIGQKIAAESWKQALTLLENAQTEFPGAPELDALREQVDAGLKESECEAVITEVRQCMADGELDQAEQLLSRGLQLLGPEPAIQALREELEFDRKYREELRKAQVLFGRRQLPEAERVLAEIAAPEHPEAQALLDAVRQARAATEEEDFCEQGHQKALELIQQQQFAQAVDLLTNLLGLFPDNPILERDLKTAQSGLPHVPEVVARPGKKRREVKSVVTSQPHPGSRIRFVVIAGTVALVLISATGVIWKFSRNAPPVSKPAVTLAATPAPAQTQLPVTPNADAPSVAPPIATPQNSSPQVTASQPAAQSAALLSKAKAQPQPEPSRSSAPLRQFVPPNAKQTPGQIQGVSVPPPPGVEPAISAQTFPGLPANLVTTAPVPPAAAQPQPVVSTPAPAANAIPPGGRFQEPQLIHRTLPTYPTMARLRATLGTVRLDAVIDEQGSVKNVKVVSGDPTLASAAKSAVILWKYKPATLNDKPIATNLAIQIVFGDREK